MASTTATPFVGSHSHESICPVGIPRARLDSGRLSLRHPAYRDFERWRIETNDAGVAVLLGLRLGRAHLLGLPPALRRERLPELVDIEDAWRLNLPGDEVIERMHDSEAVYAAMAIPFHVAVFNEFLVTALEMLQGDGKALDAGRPDTLMLGQLRAALSNAGVDMPRDQDKIMDFAQKLRNSIVHDGAVARVGIVKVWRELSQQQRAIWIEDAGRPPQIVSGERIPLGPGEVRATLAVTTHLGRRVNNELERLISRATWARIAVDDWRSEFPDKWSDWERRTRNVLGWARHEYGSLGLTEAEVETALAALK
jgi:hypothetical protein